ncbi:glycosyl hydrolase [Bacteroides sp. 519]|uniref:glycosyl hydrolase n=1 Tax=Bacteroides sp. 519 TaxID=2302937 RepID=UPI0013D82969|nr:glycosyl hydrolase [Bacteroides sp. 519]NDV60566.1 beta-mannosidase [Bacteroides sp. 519]
MKRILFLYVCLLTFTCCSSDKGEPETPILEAPKLVSSQPANGQTEVLETVMNIELLFDQTIQLARAHNITLNGVVVYQPEVNNKTVKVKVKLEKGKQYILKIPSGSIIGVTDIPTETITISFETIKEPVPEISTNLVAEDPSVEAQKLYNYLLQNYETKTLSAMMADVSWNTDQSEQVYAWTGKYPAINCYDYIHLAWSPANWIDYSNITPVKSWWDAGGIVAAGWHWVVPPSEGITEPSKMTYKPEETSFRAKNATIEGTWENNVVKADLEKIAGYLKLLKEEGIPILWRPLHEAAGNIYEYNNGTAWFWWGNDGAEAYKKLWMYMFDYFKSQDLNNLIWVWTTQTKDDAFYPGDEYVDIIGRDLYNMNAANCVIQYKVITNTYAHKIVTLSECGTVGLISEQWKAGARWSWFMPWYGEGHANQEWWIDAMKQDYVITRNQLPGFK